MKRANSEVSLADPTKHKWLHFQRTKIYFQLHEVTTTIETRVTVIQSVAKSVKNKLSTL